MLFKFSTIVAAAALLATANAAVLKRQDEVPVTLVVTPTPAPDASANLVTEFNYVIGRNLVEALAVTGGPTTTIISGNSTVTGPSPGLTYTVSSTLAAVGFSAAEVTAAASSWVGTSLNGLIGVSWFVDSVTF